MAVLYWLAPTAGPPLAACGAKCIDDARGRVLSPLVWDRLDLPWR